VPRQKIDAAVKEALQLVHLDGAGGRYPRQLSGGQQQRVALARAIAIKPRLLLLDEPLSNLDAKLRDAMRDEIRRVQREVGITAVFVTHDQSEALAMADRMAVMEHGRIVQIDTPEKVYEFPADPFIAGFIGQANLTHGTVRQVDGLTALVDTETGLTMRGVTEKPLRAGQDVVAVVKMDCVRLSRQPTNGLGASLPVRVQSRTFLGATMSYACKAGATQLTAILPRLDRSDFAVGEDLFANWQDADCLIVAAPKRPEGT
jgi:ABC-type Fe3+/spermidine/putrescine transport system ATPase subunit